MILNVSFVFILRSPSQVVGPAASLHPLGGRRAVARSAFLDLLTVSSEVLHLPGGQGLAEHGQDEREPGPLARLGIRRQVAAVDPGYALGEVQAQAEAALGGTPGAEAVEDVGQLVG